MAVKRTSNALQRDVAALIQHNADLEDLARTAADLRHKSTRSRRRSKTNHAPAMSIASVLEREPLTDGWRVTPTCTRCLNSPLGPLSKGAFEPRVQMGADSLTGDRREMHGLDAHGEGNSIALHATAPTGATRVTLKIGRLDRPLMLSISGAAAGVFDSGVAVEESEECPARPDPERQQTYLRATTSRAHALEKGKPLFTSR
jgi:hypothetical protein